MHICLRMHLCTDVYRMNVQKFGSRVDAPNCSITFLHLIPQPLQIKSVIAVEGLKGYIYVEAYKQQHVKQAIEDIGNLRVGMWQQLMVPIKEMTDVLRVVKDIAGLKHGSWVRIKRGIYRDDLAQVSSAGGGGGVNTLYAMSE